MPTLAIVDGIVMRMYYADHGPPHFHAVRGEHEILVAIATLTVIGGKCPAAMQRTALAWARNHQPALLECWNHCQRGEKPARLAP